MELKNIARVSIFALRNTKKTFNSPNPSYRESSEKQSTLDRAYECFLFFCPFFVN